MPDEAAWQKATPATDFRQRDPDNGEPATEQTEVRVIFDQDRIVLGVTCFDSDPGKLLGNQMQRDQPFSADDRFMWAIDPFLDGRSGYFFEINPSGAMGDGLISGPTGGGGFGGETNKSWDGIWLARVRRTSLGWSAEIEIPFKTVNFDPDAPAWGANFQRTVRRKNEESLWTGWLRNEGLTLESEVEPPSCDPRLPGRSRDGPQPESRQCAGGSQHSPRAARRRVPHRRPHPVRPLQTNRAS